MNPISPGHRKSGTLHSTALSLQQRTLTEMPTTNSFRRRKSLAILKSAGRTCCSAVKQFNMNTDPFLELKKCVGFSKVVKVHKPAFR